MKKRILSSFLAMCMAVMLFPVMAHAEENVLESSDVYDDVSLTDAMNYLSGSGTADDPFQIWTADDLYYVNYIEYWRDISDSTTIYYYQQNQNLDLSNATQFEKATGYITANFGGVYDGGGYSISGMQKPLFYFTKGTYIGDQAGSVFKNYVSGQSHSVIFSAIVRNLTIDQPNIHQTVATDVIEQIGAVAAYGINTAFYNITVSGGAINGISGAAAIVGRAGSVVVDQCTSDATIYASMHRASGLIANLRVVDDAKNATTTSLVTNSAFSGDISGPQDGNRGAGGIVGGVYIDGETTLDEQLPLYVTDCTVSGATISSTTTSNTANTGGIIGIVFPSIPVEITGNTVTNTTITATSNGNETNVGGVIGSLESSANDAPGLYTNIADNTVTDVTMSASDHAQRRYAGQQIGSFQSLYREIGAGFTISEDGQNDGTYGNVTAATFPAGIVIDSLNLPTGDTNRYTFRIEKDAEIGSLTVGSTDLLIIYNWGTIGELQNTAGSITIADNSGKIGNITSGNSVTIGANNQADDTGGYLGNTGAISDITAVNNINIYRNAAGADIGNVESTQGSVTIGQYTAAYGSYNTNAGTIGSVTAATSVNLYGLGQEGAVATAEGAAITAGTTVAIGHTTIIGDSALLNQNAIGPVHAGTSVSVYNGKGQMDSITAGTAVSIYANGGGIGNVTADTTITVGASNKTESDNGSGAYTGNTAVIGDMTATGNVTIYRNAEGANIGNVESTGGSVTIGQNNASYIAYNTNAGSIGSVTAATTISVYGAATGSIATGDNEKITANSTITIGSVSIPNQSAVGDIENPNGTVTGYTTGSVGTITAKTNNLLQTATSGEAGSSNVITANQNITLTANSDGTILVNNDESMPYPSGSKLVLTANSIVTFSGSNTVTLSEIQTASTLTLLDENGIANIGSIVSTNTVTVGNNSTLFKGEIGTLSGGSVTVGNSNASYYFQGKITGNITGTGVTIYNAGVIGSADGNTAVNATAGNLSVTNGIRDGADGSIVIYSNLNNNSDGASAIRSISLTNNTNAAFEGNIINNAAGAATLSITNNGQTITGNITNTGTGALTLSGNYNGTTYTDNKFANGTISTQGNLVITGSLGANNSDNGITVLLTDEATISVANHYFYLKVNAAADQAIHNLTVVSTATTADRNTIDLTELGSDLTVSPTLSNASATTLKMTDGTTTGAGYGTLVTVSSNQVTNADAIADSDAYTSNGTLIVNSTDTICKDKTLTLTGSSVTLYNFGTVGNIQHLGTGTLTIYNIGENAEIGNIVSTNGSVTIQTNDGTIANITAKGSVNVGASNKSDMETNTTVNVTYAHGNNGVIGDIIANNGSVNIYRNAENATITSVTSVISSVAIGQNSANYSSYNTNNGTIGGVKATTSFTVYGTGTGSVAAGTDETIEAGTTVTIGATTVVNDSALLNQNDIGPVTAAGNITITNGTSAIGNVTSTGGSVSINANGGTIGNLTAKTTITVGSDNRTDANNGSGAYVGNTGSLGNITAEGNAAIKRNTAEATIGAVISTGGSVSIGQNTATSGVSAYNTNSGIIGRIEAATSIGIYGTGSGSIATGTDESIQAGTSVAIGSTTIADGIALLNQNKLGSIKADTNINIYNGNGEFSDIEAGTSVGIYANTGKIGDVTAGTTVTVGADNKTESDNGSGAYVGNAGTIGNITAASYITIKRNAENATIGHLTSTGSYVYIGQNSETYVTYNCNAGSIGSVSAAANITIYRNAATGRIAVNNGESVTAKTGLTVGSTTIEAMKNFGSIGSMSTEGGTMTIVNDGTISALTNTGTGNTNLYIFDNAQTMNAVTASGTVNLYDKTSGSTPAINLTADGGTVMVNANDDGTTNIQVHLTATDKLTDGQSMPIRGTFATVIHNGAGDVIMESSDTHIAVVVENSTGQVMAFGSVSDNLTDVTDHYILSIAQVGPDTAEVRLVSTDGTVLPAGSISSVTINGCDAEWNENGVSSAITGGTLSELIGTLNLRSGGELTIGISYTPSGSETDISVTGSINITIPELIERIDTLLLTSPADFDNAKAAYGWTDEVSAPADTAYPVLAVMPVINNVYADTAVTVYVNDAQAANNVTFISVAIDGMEAGSELTATVNAHVGEANDPGSIHFSDTAVYTLTAADLAKLDTANEYYYVTYDYRDGTTNNLVVPVIQSESTTLPAAPTRTGYSFLGWSDGTNTYLAESAYTPEADSTLYALWNADAITYTLTLETGIGGSIVRVDDAGNEYSITSGTLFAAGKTIMLKAKNNSGYYFNTWTVNGETQTDPTITLTMNSDMTVSASFGRYSTNNGSSGSATSWYTISVGSTSNGTVTVNRTNATRGNTVTITVTPDSGYQLGSLIVTDRNGDEVRTEKTGDNTYTFTMPASRVTVTATFTEITSDLPSDEQPFTDVSANEYYYDAVLWAVEAGVTEGTSTTTFSPNDACTRAQMVTFLWRAAGSPSSGNSVSPFVDVSSSAYYYDAVLWAVAQGITNGTSDTTFSPDDTVTRAQTVTFLYRQAGSPIVEGSSFADVPADAYYANAVRWAVNEGITNGTSATTFSPDDACTRAQIVTLLYRAQ